MISEDTLGLAVARDIITVTQAESLRALEGETANAPDRAAPDDEALRFVSGFSDIFVTIGIALFMGALGYIVRSMADGAVASLSLAGAAWLLAEYFARRRRMALPSIVLLALFVLNLFIAFILALDSVLPVGAFTLPGPLWMLQGTNGLTPVLAGLVTTAAAALHYVRFKVPITIAAGVATLCIALLGLVMSLVPAFNMLALNAVVLLCGLLTFALAMRFDLSDPLRATRRTDIAFWLHLLAAPLIVHTLVRGLLHGTGGPTTLEALGVLAIFMILGAVAVVIDRRAILVSGLVYAGIAFGTLIRTFGFTGTSLLLPVVLLMLGGFILLLSAGWHPLRRFLLRLFPAALASRLPHPLVASTS